MGREGEREGYRGREREEEREGGRGREREGYRERERGRNREREGVGGAKESEK